MDYCSALEVFRNKTNSFISILKSDIDYKRTTPLHGMCVIMTNKAKGKVTFRINNLVLDYREGNLYFGSYKEEFVNKPYILQLVIRTLHQMWHDEEFIQSNQDIHDCMGDMIDAFLYLQGWLESVGCGDITFDSSWISCSSNKKINSSDAYSDNYDENRKFWEEYYEYNPNDI